KLISNYFPNLAYDSKKEKFQRINFLLVLDEIKQELPIVAQKEHTIQHYSFHLIHESKTQYFEIFELIQQSKELQYDIYLSLPPDKIDKVFLCRYQIPLRNSESVLLNSAEGILYL